MKNLITGIIAILMTTTHPLLAASIVDNFNGENGGVGQLNYAGFSQFDVMNGSIDLVHQGDYGLSCAGGFGSCVDLDGSTGTGGRITTKNALSFNAGDKVTLRFALSGNQRVAGSDDFDAGFDFTSPMAINDYTLGGAYGTFNLGNFFTSSIDTSSSIGYAKSFAIYTLSFTAGQAGSAFSYIGTTSSDNNGPILDNFSFSAIGTPEPATWALMVIGMGAVGYAMRRRQSTIVTYA